MITSGWPLWRRTGESTSGLHCLRRPVSQIYRRLHICPSCMIRTNLLQSIESDASSLDVHRVAIATIKLNELALSGAFSAALFSESTQSVCARL
eukprot:1354335-Pleurochrysis_carterae.AAC.1